MVERPLVSVVEPVIERLEKDAVGGLEGPFGIKQSLVDLCASC